MFEVVISGIAAVACAVAAGAAAWSVWQVNRVSSHLTGYAAALGEGLDESLDRLERLQDERNLETAAVADHAADCFDEEFGRPQGTA